MPASKDYKLVHELLQAIFEAMRDIFNLPPELKLERMPATRPKKSFKLSKRRKQQKIMAEKVPKKLVKVAKMAESLVT